MSTRPGSEPRGVVRGEGRGEGIEVVVPAAQLHEARRDLAVVEVLVEPLQRRNDERALLPFGEPYLALFSVLEGHGAVLVRPHQAEAAAVEQDDGRAGAVAVGALVGVVGDGAV